MDGCGHSPPFLPFPALSYFTPPRHLPHVLEHAFLSFVADRGQLDDALREQLGIIFVEDILVGDVGEQKSHPFQRFSASLFVYF